MVAVAALGCGFADVEADSDGGSCSQTATCDPEGLLLFVSWVQGEGWPTGPTEIHAHHPDLSAPIIVDCHGGPGVTPAVLTCAPRCDGGVLRDDGVCEVALPTDGGDDPTFGALLDRQFEVWVDIDDGSPVLRALEAERRELSYVRKYPRVLDVTFHDQASTWSWAFAPPHVHIDASATGTLDCPVELCDGLFVGVEVSKLDPVT